MYLDCDTTPPTHGGYIRSKTVLGAIRVAKSLMSKSGVLEGQIGIYENGVGDGFKGYVIRYPNSEPYFEPPQDEK